MSDVDVQRLYSTTDAHVWAEEFAKVFPDVDQGTMIGWFANAMMTAHDHARRQAANEVEEALRPALEHLDGHRMLERFLAERG